MQAREPCGWKPIEPPAPENTVAYRCSFPRVPRSCARAALDDPAGTCYPSVSTWQPLVLSVLLVYAGREGVRSGCELDAAAAHRGVPMSPASGAGMRCGAGGCAECCGGDCPADRLSVRAARYWVTPRCWSRPRPRCARSRPAVRRAELERPRSTTCRHEADRTVIQQWIGRSARQSGEPWATSP